MSATLRMEHKVDPRDELMKWLPQAERIDVFNNQVMIAVYERPAKTAAGIYLSDRTRREDEYQGKVGLVLKAGPLAFMDDERNHFHGQKVEVGEWVALRPGDGWPFKLVGEHGTQPCRMLEDVHIKMRLPSPDAVY